MQVLPTLTEDDLGEIQVDDVNSFGLRRKKILCEGMKKSNVQVLDTDRVS